MTFGVESAKYVRADLRTDETFVFVAMILIITLRRCVVLLSSDIRPGGMFKDGKENEFMVASGDDYQLRNEFNSGAIMTKEMLSLRFYRLEVWFSWLE